MRKILTILFVFFLPALAFTQIFNRYAGQSADSLVKTTLNGYSAPAGVYEFRMQGALFILYFQHQFPTNVPEYREDGSTIFNILFSQNGVQYQKYMIDIIDKGGSCWQAVQPDSLLFFNADEDPELEICVVLRHIPICDVLLPFTSAMFFDNLETLPKTGTLKSFPTLAFRSERFGFPR